MRTVKKEQDEDRIRYLRAVCRMDESEDPQGGKSLNIGNTYVNCSNAKYDCCFAIWRAKHYCSKWPNSTVCRNAYDEANYFCAIAAEECTTFTCTDTNWDN